MTSIDPGIDVDRLVSAPLSVNLLRYTTAQGRAFYQQVVERAGRIPGVEAASVARVAMLTGGGRILSVHVEGRPSTTDRVMSEGGSLSTPDPGLTNANVVGPRFFETIGIRVVNGREHDADQHGAHDDVADGRQLALPADREGGETEQGDDPHPGAADAADGRGRGRRGVGHSLILPEAC